MCDREIENDEKRERVKKTKRKMETKSKREIKKKKDKEGIEIKTRNVNHISASSLGCTYPEISQAVSMYQID